MIERLRLLISLPNQLLLAWRLFRDPRVPVFSKAVAVGALGFIFSPLDLLEWIPFAGGLTDLALGTLVLRAFIGAAPQDVREEHMATLGMNDV